MKTPSLTSKATPSTGSAGGGLSPQDVLYALFKHQGLILALGLIGLLAAGAFYLLSPRLYESRAKLLVRYVLERSPVDPIDSQRETNGREGMGVIQSEIQILTSWDLARTVAAKLVPGDEVNQRAADIVMSLGAFAARDSNVIEVVYASSEPAHAQTILSEYVNAYFDRHLAVHRSAGAFDYVSARMEEVRSRVKETEERLRTLKDEAGILSLSGSHDALGARLAATEQELLSADALVAEQTARVREIERSEAAAPRPGDAAPEPRAADSTTVQRYRALISRLSELRQEEFDLLARFTSDNWSVRQQRARIAEAESQIRQLENAYPALVARAGAGSSLGSGGRPDLVAERAALAAAIARRDALRGQLAKLREQASRLAGVAPEIGQLERRREVEAANLKYLESSLEKARADEALDPSKIPNISVVQAPSPPMRVGGKTKKVAAALAGGGFALGVGLALLLELLVNRSVKRPYELESRLGIPQIAMIPMLPHRRGGTLGKRRGGGPAKPAPGGGATVAPWEADHFLHDYGAALRQRLIHLFEVEEMTHKPKMVGVTSASAGAGVSTIACSLASALSETGEGKVLLVDANPHDASAHRFFGGRPATLSQALEPAETRAEPRVPDVANLYLAATAPTSGERVACPQKALYEMLPRFRASDYDYVIFDLPPIGHMSPTETIAGFLDKVILVAEAEKTDRDALSRAHRALTAAKASVLGVINKLQVRVPTWVEAVA